MRPAFGLAFLAFAALFLGLLFSCPYCNEKSASISTACLSDVKQLALGEVIYASDHDERFTAREMWMDGVRPYVYSEANFQAPEFAKTASGAYGYAFDTNLSRAKEPPHPERVPLVFESTNLGKNASDPMTSLPRPGRHGGKDNVAYADGHSRRVAP